MHIIKDSLGVRLAPAVLSLCVLATSGVSTDALIASSTCALHTQAGQRVGFSKG